MKNTRPPHAGAYLIGDDIIVYPLAFTVDGIGVSVPPVHRLSRNAPRSNLGAALRDALFTPVSIVPPRFWKERAELGVQFLKAARVRSWRQLQLSARNCNIVAADGLVRLTPLRNGGTRGDTKGFQPFGAADLTVPDSASDDELGTALVEALDQSK